jgi:hypothetical protein
MSGTAELPRPCNVRSRPSSSEGVLATVAEGDEVTAGQAIGTTAPNECTPQLQFGVYPANGEALPGAPEARALPIVFDGVGALREGGSYVVP